MKLEEIVTGRTYRIRSWEDITHNEEPYIPSPSVGKRWRCDPSPILFVERMRPICGMEFTVVSYPDAYSLRSKEDVECRDKERGMRWEIAPWMLEEIEEEIEEPDKDLFDFLLRE